MKNIALVYVRACVRFEYECTGTMSVTSRVCVCVACDVVCGVWCVVCGVWCVVCGVWCVVCGVWCVVCVCGVWCVVCGVWCVWCVLCVCGVWCVCVCGVWCVVRGVWCVVRGVWCVCVYFFLLLHLLLFYRSFLKTSLISLYSQKCASCANRGTLAK
jgi:hypothetical protein